jgi:hypothetical protein
MKSKIDKAQKNEHQSVSKSASKVESNGESSFQFADNRPEMVAQRKLQEMVNNSPNVMQLQAYQEIANNSQQVKQMKALKVITDSADNAPIQMVTSINNTSQDYTYRIKDGAAEKTESVKVGKKMTAWLDPDNPIKGQSADVNTSQDRLMSSLKKQYITNYKKNSHALVKGHLLNDNLGGKALNENLFPITKIANADHLGFVENLVKKRLWTEGKPTYYEVEVNGSTSDLNPIASFETKVHEWPDKDSPNKGALVASVSIPSNFLDYKSSEVNPEEHERFPNPAVPYGIEEPYKRYQDLPADQLMERNTQTVEELDSTPVNSEPAISPKKMLENIVYAIAELKESEGSRLTTIHNYLEENGKIINHVTFRIVIRKGVKDKILVKKGEGYKLNIKK